MKKTISLLLAIILLLPAWAGEKGKVYLVVGSDTSIWDGLVTSIYDGRYFRSGLYSDPQDKAYAVMDTSFRGQLRDSDDTPMKMTWWMMAGNVFRLSNNCNIPVRNNISLYLMKKYHQKAIDLWDDQLSLHYHTYNWSDPELDGIYSWQMAEEFLLNLDDYERTLCSFLIEDDVFPVSFRSGWMYMDEDWQAYQERFIPFDMSDCWTNISNGSVPFHPSADNYRSEGDMKQWRVRSIYFTVYSSLNSALDIVFREAGMGNDQMLCLWSHLPEASFLDGMDSLNVLAHQLSKRDSVEFHYYGDVEAMRRWIAPEDTTAPILNVNEINDADGIRYEISTDGPVFQSDEPFVALKTIFETYERLDCQITGLNTWQTVKALDPEIAANIAVAVCDSVGNQTTYHIDRVPGEIYIDDKSDSYNELAGNWSDYSGDCELWDLNARVLNGLGKCSIEPEINKDGTYALFLHAPGSESDSTRIIVSNSLINDTLLINKQMQGRDAWQYAGIYDFKSDEINTISVENLKQDLPLGFDVLRVTPLIADKNFTINKELIVFGDISIGDTAEQVLVLSNKGKSIVHVNELSLFGSLVNTDQPVPFDLGPMESKEIRLRFHSDSFCEYHDVLTIKTDDPRHPENYIPVFASSSTYYQTYDNEDISTYHEHGDWHTSDSKAWGNTSRYALIGPDHNYADYDITLEYSGLYGIEYLIPNSTNAHDHANYIIIVDDIPIDTIVIDQNSTTKSWEMIGEFELPKNTPIKIRVQDNGGNISSSAAVIRADAIKLTLLEERFISKIEKAGIPLEFKLYQNYPNPFNPSTSIYFALPERGEVKIDFYDLQGKKVDRTLIQDMEAGFHYITWEPADLSSGVYLYRVSTDHAAAIGKCTYLK